MSYSSKSIRVQVSAQERISISAKMRQQFHMESGSTVVLKGKNHHAN